MGKLLNLFLDSIISLFQGRKPQSPQSNVPDPDSTLNLRIFAEVTRACSNGERVINKVLPALGIGSTPNIMA